ATSSWFFQTNLGKGVFSPDFTALHETRTTALGVRSLITFEERDHAESYVADMDASGRNAILIANKGEAQALDADGGAIGPTQPFNSGTFAIVAATTHPTAA